MVDAILYFRTFSVSGYPNTRAVDAGFASPTSLPTAQKITFTSPSNIFEGVDEEYENIINTVPSVNSSGTRRVFVKDSGMRSRIISIKGRLQNISTDVTKLKTFRKLLQQDSYHIHGSFGVFYPSATFFSIDPTNLRGLSIAKIHVGHTGKILKRAMFVATLVFGGEHE